MATQISAEVPVEFAQSLSVVYFPQLGYLITIPHDGDSGDPIPEREGWQFQVSPTPPSLIS